MSEHPTPDAILQVGLGFWPSKILLRAVDMELFTDLAKGPRPLERIPARIGLHPRSARDFLDALVALGFLLRTDGEYRNTPATDAFLDKRKPSCIGGLLEMANSRLYGFWNHSTEALRTGLPQSEPRSGGQPLFETLYADPARLKLFLGVMTGVSHGANIAIGCKFPWALPRNACRAPGTSGLDGHRHSLTTLVQFPHCRCITTADKIERAAGPQQRAAIRARHARRVTVL